MKKLVWSLLLTAISATPALAQETGSGSGLPYTGISITHTSTDIDDMNDEASGFTFGGRFVFASNFFVSAEFGSAETDGKYTDGQTVDEISLKERAIGIGGFAPIAPKVDFVGAFNLVKGTFEFGSYEEDVDGNVVQLGIRMAPIPEFGILIEANRSDIEDETDTYMSFGIEMLPVRQFSFALQFTNDDEGDSTSFSVNFYFD